MDKRPYIFKLSSRIETDIAAIEKMRRYENENGVDLKDFLGSAEVEPGTDGE